ncbi:LD-carboxypeptidase [Peribacillus sp. SCS-155]|uniref:S66 peptidase family protein n=1 Tax=Peribacillus sedimenti TaxID=3115297 RepID=UPI0039066F59
MIVTPKRLEQGDTVGVIAPASPPDRTNVERALGFLESLGLKVKLGEHIWNKNGYLAGTDKERLEDLHGMFADQEVKAIFSACGGYGTARLASQMDYGLIRSNPKILWGYSDITFLHNAIHKETGLVTFHGPMLSSDIGKGDAHPLSKKLFHQLFEPNELIYTEEFSTLEAMVEGKAEGALTGGNLSLLTSTLGTRFEVETNDKLLLIEDINEEPRAVDRMLNQLFMAGKLQAAAGILVGDFNNCVPDRPQSLTLDEVLNHYIHLAGKPALRGFKIGHCSPHISVPLGVHAELDTYQKQVRIQPGVS